MERIIILAFVFTSQQSALALFFTNDFAVELAVNQSDSDAAAAQLAKSHGFFLHSKLDHLNVYHFVHPEVATKSVNSAVHYVNKLSADPRVSRVFQQEHLFRSKRNSPPVIHDKQQELPSFAITDNSLYRRLVPQFQTKQVISDHEFMKFNDPYFADQWYLNNVGQTGGKVGLDLNVEPAWRNNFTGAGLIVCILDDGIDHTHPDLINNFDAAASLDLNRDDLDPMPDTRNPNNGHGTRCAGAVAAKANNSVCGVGVAYEAKIGGIRMLDGTITDLLESKALLFKPNYIHIYSASWGPLDDGATMEAPKSFARAALQEGVKKGRNGLGVIYVWATGNGGLTFDDCNADGYVSSIETLAVGSVSNNGEIPYFMEQCTSTMAVIPTGGQKDKPTANVQHRNIEVVTTGLHGQCIENFEGTSGAAPLASGCIALVLQANPHLTWRDVQHLVVHSARIPSSGSNWFRNGAGLHVSHSFGFGLMDCGRMVELAQNWHNVPPQRKCVYTSADMNKKVSFGVPIKVELFCSGCSNLPLSHLTHIEHVQVYINLKHSTRGDVQIFLTSPAGTKSQLLSPRKFDKLKDIDFYFMTVHNWMENPYGNWTLEIHDKNNNGNDGILQKWSLILFGYKLDRKWENLNTVKMTDAEIGETMEKEFSRKLNIRRHQNTSLNKKLTRLGKSVPSYKNRLANFSESLASIFVSSLTQNELAKTPRSVSQYEDEPLMFRLSEKIIKPEHESKLSEEFQPKPKSILRASLGEVIANDYYLNKKRLEPKSRQNLSNPLAAKFEHMIVKADEFESEFSALKKLLNQTDSPKASFETLYKEYMESNPPKRNIDSKSDEKRLPAANDAIKPNSFNVHVSPAAYIFAEKMFFPSFDLRQKQYTTTHKTPHFDLASAINSERAKHNILRKLLQNLRFYLQNSKSVRDRNLSVGRRESLPNSLLSEPFGASKQSEPLNRIDLKKLGNVSKIDVQQSELEEELNLAKEQKKMQDESKLYPRSI